MALSIDDEAMEKKIALNNTKTLDDSKYRQGGVGQCLYGLINRMFYFLPIVVSNLRFRRLLFMPLYREKAKAKQSEPQREKQKTIIYMVLQETTFSGGLADRLRAITSIYAECKRQALPFRIVFEPLHLQDYLQPNTYDWRIEEQDIIWDTKRCYPCTILTYHHNLKSRLQRFVQRTLLHHFMGKRAEQIHIYSNMATEETRYGELFKELFVPTGELQEQIDFHLHRIGGAGNYVSMTFRFRQLLGDFKEGGEILDANERTDYTRRCITCVEQMHRKIPGKRILVTSDSTTFLAALHAHVYGEHADMGATDGWLYLIPGKVVHIGFTFDANRKTYMKSFIDYYMLSYASTIYLIRDKRMYHSGFPYRAALLNGADYEEIHLNQPTC